MIVTLARISRRIHEYSHRLVVRWRRFLLTYQVAWWNGKMEIGSGVRLEHPVIFQGSGRLILQEGVTLGFSKGGASTQPILLQPRKAVAVIQIGARTTIVNGTEMIARTAITIGHDCLIGARCQIVDSDFHGIYPDERNTPGLTSPVTIGDNVWLGSNVFVLKGVNIGKDAVVGAGCVVTKDIPAGVIAVGNPMKIIGSVYKRTKTSRTSG